LSWPSTSWIQKKDVDARDKRGHDEFVEAVDCISYTESTV
jgi:hypothetical protein